MFFTQKRLKVYLAALLVLQVLTWLNGSSLLRDSYIDFRTFYTAGAMLRTGHAGELYDYDAEQRFQSRLVAPADRALPMMCPPYTALLFVPLSLLSFHSAYVAFLLVNVGLLWLSAALLATHLAALRARWPPGAYALCFAFLPACIALLMGQLSLLILLLYCLAFHTLRRGRPMLAGLLVALALVKFQIALPVALLFLLWRQWRFFAGFVAGGCALTALSAATVGRANLLPYLASLVAMTGSITHDLARQAHFAILPAQMPNLYGLLFTLAGSSLATVPVTLLASLIVFVWSATRSPSLPRALLAAILVSYHLFLYDLTLLLLPLGVILNQMILDDGQPREPGRRLPARWLTPAAAGVLLIAPVERMLIAARAIYLLALPILLLNLDDRYLAGPARPVLPHERGGREENARSGLPVMAAEGRPDGKLTHAPTR